MAVVYPITGKCTHLPAPPYVRPLALAPDLGAFHMKRYEPGLKPDP